MQLCQPPPPLRPGDRLRAIAPSGALREFSALEQGLEIWRSRGYQVELSTGYDAKWGYLAGPDEARRRQWREALLDPDCKGLLCIRGGWGGARVLEEWSWPEAVSGDPLQPVQLQPPALQPAQLQPQFSPAHNQVHGRVHSQPANKWLIGFSDITSLLLSLAQQGVSGVHGPLLTTLAQEPGWSQARLFDWVEGRSIGPLQGEGWIGGVATGVLLPINLTVATHLLGSCYQPDFSNVILAIEDVGEAPYRIDRMLTQWRLMGIFQQVKGIALGRFSLCDAPPNIPSFSMYQVLRDRLGDLNIPIVSGLAFGHEGENAALPVGVAVELDGDRGQLRLAPADGARA